MDQVIDWQGEPLYADVPDKVKAWLEDPNNAYPNGPVGDTTRVTYGAESPRAFTTVYASDYLADFDQVYPNGS
jgi:hypothetical protein